MILHFYLKLWTKHSKEKKSWELKRGLSWFLSQRGRELPSPLRKKRLSCPKSNFPNVWQNNLGGIHFSNKKKIYAIVKLSKMRYLKLFYILDLEIWAKIYDERKLGVKFPSALLCKEKAKEKRTQLLARERLLENLTLGLPFCHNFSFINSNWESKTIWNIYISRPFQWYNKRLIWTTFVY